MYAFLEILLDFGILAIISIVGFVVFMMIQGITYWTTGFSIYNYIMKKLFN